MSDPIHDLENFNAEGLPVNPLAPSEVRRLGDRMRRRRNAAAMVAGVAAVAVIAAPIALFAGRDDSSAPSPAPSPSESTTGATIPESGSWITEIPAGFPLAAGYPETNGNDGSPVEVTAGGGPEDVLLCDQALWRNDAGIDRVGTGYDGEAEDTRRRALVLFPDNASATAALEDARKALDGCPSESFDGGVSDSVHSEIGKPFALSADDHLVFSTRYRNNELGGFGTGLSLSGLVRVGNALLFAVEHGEGGGSPGSIEASVGSFTDGTDRVVQELCVFAEHPCEIKGDPPAGGDLSAALPTETDVSYNEGAHWVETATLEGESPEGFSPCARSTLDSLGAGSVAQRDFVLEGIQGEPAEGTYLKAVVAELPQEALALDAYDLMADNVRNCRPFIIEQHGADSYQVSDPVAVSTGDLAGKAERFLSTYGPVAGDTFQEQVYFLETGLAVLGNRLLVLTMRVPGQDYNFEGKTPGEASLERAVTRLK